MVEVGRRIHKNYVNCNCVIILHQSFYGLVILSGDVHYHWNHYLKVICNGNFTCALYYIIWLSYHTTTFNNYIASNWWDIKPQTAWNVTSYKATANCDVRPLGLVCTWRMINNRVGRWWYDTWRSQTINDTTVGLLYVFLVGVAVLTSNEWNSLVWLHGFLLKTAGACAYIKNAHIQHFTLFNRINYITS